MEVQHRNSPPDPQHGGAAAAAQDWERIGKGLGITRVFVRFQ